MSNLPTWSGASACYSRAYRVLESMAKRASPYQMVRMGDTSGRRSSSYIIAYNEDMNELIDALNKGDEERIKGLLLLTHVYY